MPLLHYPPMPRSAEEMLNPVFSGHMAAYIPGDGPAPTPESYVPPDKPTLLFLPSEMLQTAVVYDSLASSPAFAAFNVLLYEFGVQVPEHALSLAAAPTALPPDAVSFVAQDILAALRTLAYLPNDEELAQGVKSEKLHLVGCSMSAMSTLVMAALLGDVVETVMLISPLALGLTAHTSFPTQDEQLARDVDEVFDEWWHYRREARAFWKADDAGGAGQLELEKNAHRLILPRGASDGLRHHFMNESPWPRHLEPLILSHWCCRWVVKAHEWNEMRALVQLLEAERSRGGPACPASLADVTARVLVVAGSDIERAWKESIPALQAALSNADFRLETLEGAPMLICVAERFSGRVRELLAEHVSPEDAEAQLAAKKSSSLQLATQQQLQKTLEAAETSVCADEKEDDDFFLVAAERPQMTRPLSVDFNIVEHVTTEHADERGL